MKQWKSEMKTTMMKSQCTKNNKSKTTVTINKIITTCITNLFNYIIVHTSYYTMYL